MTGPERDQEMREVAREVLRELMPGVLRDAGSASGSGSGEGNGHSNGASQQAGNAHHHGAANGHGSSGRTVASSGQATVVPHVPAPPVAACPCATVRAAIQLAAEGVPEGKRSAATKRRASSGRKKAHARAERVGFLSEGFRVRL